MNDECSILAKSMEMTKRMKLHAHVNQWQDENGLQYLEIDNPLATGKIALQGAHVMHWQPKFLSHPVLWLSSNARYVKGRSIRGGVPICWPWFGAHPTDSTLCPHGFARVIPWRVMDIDATPTGATRIILEMQQTPEAQRQLSYPYELTLTITIGRRLRIDLATTNLAEHPFVISEAFHTYFNVSDLSNIKITGMQDLVYLDKLLKYERNVEHNPLSFDGHEYDRVYVDHSSDCSIHDSGYNRIIHVSKSGSDTTVVWNPGADKAATMGDMGVGEEWRKTICVETTNALDNMVVINPGRKHVLSAEYSIETL
ncbi:MULTISPECIES: D-hexose-6-phosphate mutarotase [unclassified Methylophilus]|jgi:glucose-6-phosphate 1-epimerase|uniref:Putative glucose-6-phosphate 1-epimerase n=1 Tax=Methylophilus glucosoxydans TaxID=752553 RepID=A0ABW3GHV3_9PROT|nr:MULTISPECIES: D-hexose-6-phosphate mutarotase [unclassified Methylophilus]MBF5039627.1 D-hexose-6-phosphate mutarotase [Methylophilus sp. 13]MDF0377825.1 D-hexose-6-phosphate mutarotase [Methylophilus sp. YYY-1]MDT7849001.1 D-hexose-6-phosphate mutarotase [Methylophilus sp. VKM B-3414]BEV09057.1 D-hexose-6-phosphate mutarotase [Methylophilus sp. DW102]